MPPFQLISYYSGFIFSVYLLMCYAGKWKAFCLLNLCPKSYHSACHVSICRIVIGQKDELLNHSYMNIHIFCTIFHFRKHFNIHYSIYYEKIGKVREYWTYHRFEFSLSLYETLNMPINFSVSRIYFKTIHFQFYVRRN